jgi:hypothetical protein
MKKLGIRRLDATSSHLVKIDRSCLVRLLLKYMSGN